MYSKFKNLQEFGGKVDGDDIIDAIDAIENIYFLKNKQWQIEKKSLQADWFNATVAIVAAVGDGDDEVVVMMFVVAEVAVAVGVGVVVVIVEFVVVVVLVVAKYIITIIKSFSANISCSLQEENCWGRKCFR